LVKPIVSITGAPTVENADENPPAQILVVDDNEGNRDLLVRLLERRGYETITAEDGLQTLEILDQRAVDLVLLDVMMPEMDGYEVLERMKAHERWRHVPVIMISALTELESVVKCIKMGAEDYLPKPFNSVLLRARVGACLDKKQLRDKEQKYLNALEESQAHLKAELGEAADYVRSMLPEPLEGSVAADWIFVPSTGLGGDLLGYHWLDDDRLALYLLDVAGHGIGAALLSVSVGNALRTSTLPNVDFGDPSAVLRGLNDAFPMEEHNNKYFTAWYGVYQKSTRELTFANGGHPPALLLSTKDDRPQVERLECTGLVIGGFPDVSFEVKRIQVEAGSQFYVFSDGAYEVNDPDGEEMGLKELERILAEEATSGDAHLENILKRVRDFRGQDTLEDDFTILGVRFH
jgi:sigma-B regulation protein RsbU (phosphoserine phosphatase)